MLSQQTQPRVRTTELSAHVGQTVHLQGWMHTLRRLGGVNFLVLRDGWGTAQAVTEQPMDFAPLFAQEVQSESIISLQGQVVASAQAPGGFELYQPQVQVINPVHETLPVLLNKRELKASQPVLLDHAVVTNRHPQRRAIFRLAASVMQSFRGYLNEQGFTEVQTPKLVASATESGANVFELGYFGRPAYLAQSPQLYKQNMVGVFERVYEVGPVFRAEPHDTGRHINEYVSLDVEFGFIESHYTVMAMLRNVLDSIFTTMTETREAELSLLKANVPTVPETIPMIHFAEAKELLYELYSAAGYNEQHEPDFSPQEERWLGEWAQAEHGSDFLFVEGYPMSKRPFYTHPSPERPAYSNSFDLLFRGTELVTGGQRLHVYTEYLAALEEAQQSPEPFEGYLEAFRYGMPPHGGFAIGLERLLMQLLGLPNVRLATLFPRTMQRLTP